MVIKDYTQIVALDNPVTLSFDLLTQGRQLKCWHGWVSSEAMESFCCFTLVGCPI